MQYLVPSPSVLLVCRRRRRRRRPSGTSVLYQLSVLLGICGMSIELFHVIVLFCISWDSSPSSYDGYIYTDRYIQSSGIVSILILYIVFILISFYYFWMTSTLDSYNVYS